MHARTQTSSSQQLSANCLTYQAGNCSVFSTGSQSCPGWVQSPPPTHGLPDPPLPTSLLHSPTSAPWLSSQMNCLLRILVSGSSPEETHTKTTLIGVYVFCFFVKDSPYENIYLRDSGTVGAGAGKGPWRSECLLCYSAFVSFDLQRAFTFFW